MRLSGSQYRRCQQTNREAAGVRGLARSMSSDNLHRDVGARGYADEQVLGLGIDYLG